ncbi:MAG: hypothetical protein GY816_21160 [Cytophagales bacterium]|nr:hypothetical protein [Cytophagales bacterium]
MAIDGGGVSSLFSNVDISWNGKCVESHNGHYQHTSFIKKLLSTSADVKEKHLIQQCLFSRPSCPTVDGTDNNNLGREQRKSHTALSRLATFCFPLDTDISSCRKLIPPGVEVNISLTHAADSTRIHSAGEVNTYFVEVIACELIVRRYTLEMGLAQEISHRLNSGEGITYNINR